VVAASLWLNDGCTEMKHGWKLHCLLHTFIVSPSLFVLPVFFFFLCPSAVAADGYMPWVCFLVAMKWESGRQLKWQGKKGDSFTLCKIDSAFGAEETTLLNYWVISTLLHSLEGFRLHCWLRDQEFEACLHFLGVKSW